MNRFLRDMIDRLDVIHIFMTFVCWYIELAVLWCNVALVICDYIKNRLTVRRVLAKFVNVLNHCREFASLMWDLWSKVCLANLASLYACNSTVRAIYDFAEPICRILRTACQNLFNKAL